MSDSRKVQEKAEKRAAALRNNLQKRKAFVKETKQAQSKKQEEQNAKS